MHMTGKVSRPAVNHVRAWRIFRQMTQEQLALAAGTSSNMISMLESGSRRLSEDWLRRLAQALGTTAGILLDYDPNTSEGRYVIEALKVPAHNRAQAITAFKALSENT